MLNIIKRSISNKLMLVVMATTLFALLVYGIAMLAYDLRTYRDSIISDLATQANIIAEISAPTLEFSDPATAKENLNLLRTRPTILAAALFTSSGKRFAEYANTSQQVTWPLRPHLINTYDINNDQIIVWKKIVRNNDLLGVVYIQAHYEVQHRLSNYIIILACVMAATLGLALIIAIWLRGAVTKPIFTITSVAQHIMQSRDFSLRAKKFTEDEIGMLSDAFNNMLDEVERRTSELQKSNQSLEYEMAERHAAEAALRIADQQKDEFLATLAHELRNPLAPLTNGLKILTLAKDNPAACENAHAIMERQLTQMVRLVDDLLDVSRITTGKLAINKTRVDIQSIIRAAIETSSGFIEACGHTLSVEMPVTPIYVNADPVRLAQVFSNLLNNAAKYTNRGGHILFRTEQNNNQLTVNISDNGIGIAPHMLKDIFNMFTQVDHSLERTHAGLGVGLALSKRLVELHGYELVAISEGIGKGSTFSVHLSTASFEQTSSQHTNETNEKNQCHRRILLVDDNEDFVTTMATLLGSFGHDVKIAHDGISAQKIARDFSPDIAFLDIGMPGMNGYDLARYLRQAAETTHTILVAITGWGQEKDRQLSKDAGFNVHLVKPVNLSTIIELIES